jgi:hypothetical protein
VALRNKYLLCTTIIISLSSSGCTLFNPNRQNWIYDGGAPKARVFVVYDSPQVRRLLADEDAREYEVSRFWRDKHSQEGGTKRIQDMALHPENYPPGRPEFLKAMVNMPGFYVPSKSYCRIIERSKSGCGPRPLETSPYILVRITTGPFRGNTGWVCENNTPGFFP